jgi:hypothetical protein
MKRKLKNHFTTHFDVIIWMFTQKFYILENVLYDWTKLKSGRLFVADMQLMFNYSYLILGNNIFIL